VRDRGIYPPRLLGITSGNEFELKSGNAKELKKLLEVDLTIPRTEEHHSQNFHCLELKMQFNNFNSIPVTLLGMYTSTSENCVHKVLAIFQSYSIPRVQFFSIPRIHSQVLREIYPPLNSGVRP